jgi:hypothetical protein
MTVDQPKPLWTPLNPEKSQLAQFQNYIAKKYNQDFGIPNKFLKIAKLLGTVLTWR